MNVRVNRITRLFNKIFIIYILIILLIELAFMF